MANPPQEQKPAGPKPSILKLSELKGFFWNWFWRIKGFRRLKVGRAKVGERQPPVWYELHKTWFPKNRAWFETKLQTVEDFWGNQGKHYGEALGEDGEFTLLGNHDGIVNLYKELGMYSDLDRLNIEVDWFEVGTGYLERDYRFEIPNDPAFWERYSWVSKKIEPFLKDPDKLKSEKLLKKIKLSPGIVYHDGKKKLREELYCFGYTNAEALAKRVSLFNNQFNVKGMQREGAPADPRNRAGEATARLVELLNEIAKIEDETFKELDKLKGLTEAYYTKWTDQVEKLSPESKKIAVTRYPHTYRIIKQYYITTIQEEIAVKGGESYKVEYDEEGNEKGKTPVKTYTKSRKVFVRLNPEKDIYEEEKEEINGKTREYKDLLDKEIIKEEHYNAILKSYQEKLDDIENNIINKQTIIRDTTPNIPKSEFWKRDEETDYGLDENGYPLEIDPNTGEVLIDKWWREIAQNEWQLETIALKAGGKDVLERHLKATVEYYEEEDNVTKKKKLRARVRNARRPPRYIRDKRFHGHVDLLELGAINYSGWDAFRDDLRDGRYHKHTKSVGDYVIACEGGFDEEKLAPYPKKMLQLPGGIGAGIGLFIKERDIIPTGPTGINMNVHDRSDLITAKPEMFENVPDEEKAITRDFKMKLPDGSIESGTRRATKYNPAFDRRAENLDYVYWGRMYYYRWSGEINEWDENPFPHISTRGIALFIDYLVKSDVWNYEDAEIALEGHKFDYGVRGATMYGEVNPAKGTGILQEN